ncbi:uncharacterized protein LOC128250244 [Octopus bimaculoides]|uniref:uncharacterized protein LOC128250244 n=1 Tax=Octopus bimaculoides TaxID=37653 RepID=UPI0022E0F290|nr:uncharacterized protein LOC128250244 [Octopus bimaculoides]
MLQTAYGLTFPPIQKVSDDKRCEREMDFRTSELVDKIRNFPYEDRHVFINIISIQFGVGVATVDRVIHEDLNIRKICAKFVLSVLILVTNYLTEKSISHSPYSLDLAPCDFWLFSKQKENLRGSRFENEGVCDKFSEHLRHGGLPWDRHKVAGAVKQMH